MRQARIAVLTVRDPERRFGQAAVDQRCQCLRIGLGHHIAGILGNFLAGIFAAPRAIEVATVLYVGAFNIGIALGSWSGGQVVDGFGLTANLWLAGGFLATALLLTLGVGLRDRRRHDALRSVPTDL